MKVITFAALKGGIGKTTLTYNYGEWLALNDKKVLMIDLDFQCNLTTRYQPRRTKKTVAEMFKSKTEATDIQIDNVKDNLDLISGHASLDQITDQLITDVNQNFKMYRWFVDNNVKYNLDQYDFVLIDTRPDFEIPVRNAIAVSDYIMNPIGPSDTEKEGRFTLHSKLDMFKEQETNPKTGETLIDAQTFVIANMIVKRELLTKDLIAELRHEDNILAYIPRSATFGQASGAKESIFTFKTSNQDLQITVSKEFKKVLAATE